MSLEFVLDYRSPYTYLANTQVADLSSHTVYQVVDIVNVMRKVHNQPSPECPAKARYSAIDSARWAKLYEVAWAPNLVLLGAMRDREFDGSFINRAGLAAQELGVFEIVNSALFAAVWAGSDDLLTSEGKSTFLKKQGCDIDIWEYSSSAYIKERLASNDETAASRGVFGVPSFFVGDELFFGNDRIEFVRAALKKLSA
ncbi:hypothetical protein E8F11_28495 [Pseudomonas sp. BN417]|uniref:2-hydroxychromene-2-carboxylate isomerase n=1 Tax=Pseudomonas sp. BN417 TaxID=2567890 RepID=UPI002454B827|nr:DsbA family protein [Pseudomonas sp. BN417]MDH4559060.1 hypothetical protein [Pseudomonas sp. BN417]